MKTLLTIAFWAGLSLEIGAQCVGTNLNLIHFEGGSDGGKVTLTALTNSLYGPAGSWRLSWSNTNNARFDASGQRNLVSPMQVCGEATNFSGGGSLGYRSDLLADYTVHFLPAQTSTVASAAAWIKTDLNWQGIQYYDTFTIYRQDNADYCNLQLCQRSNALAIGLECTGPTSGATNSILVSSNTWYWCSLLYDTYGYHKIRVYDSNLALVGELVGQANLTGRSAASYIAFGVQYSTPKTNAYVWYDNIKTCFPKSTNDLVWPLMPYDDPPRIRILPSGTNVLLTWPSAAGFLLQTATNLNPPVAWSTDLPRPLAADGTNRVLIPISGAKRFLRLSK